MTTFAHLGLDDALVAALERRGFTEPFPIQSATIPSALKGEDVSGKAPTGSGKTLAFGLPLLTRVDKASKRKPRALVLAPTRELAEQIRSELHPLSDAVGRRVTAIYGGVGYGPQKKALNSAVDVLIATPGRLEDLMERGIVDLRETDFVVVDEADRMADMGFLPAVGRILDSTKDKRQTLLFSATLDGDVGVLVDRYQTNPKRYEAESVTDAPELRHHFWKVDRSDRVDHTADVINTMGRTIVFTRTRHGADRLARQLSKAGVEAVAMHGGRSQNQRNRALAAFSKGRASALVATDVAARGIHVEGVEAVVHYDPAGDVKDFVHRSGRTGRAGQPGTVVTLVTQQDRKGIVRLQRELNLPKQITQPSPSDLVDPTNAHRRPEPSHPRREPRTSERRGRDTASTTTLFVGNLPWSTTENDLDRLFSRHGKVTATKIPTRRGRSKGYGLVEIHANKADKAIEAMHSRPLDGRKLVVRLAR